MFQILNHSKITENDLSELMDASRNYRQKTSCCTAQISPIDVNAALFSMVNSEAEDSAYSVASRRVPTGGSPDDANDKSLEKYHMSHPEQLKNFELTTIGLRLL